VVIMVVVLQYVPPFVIFYHLCLSFKSTLNAIRSELAISSTKVIITIASTHCACPPGCSWLEWLVT